MSAARSPRACSRSCARLESRLATASTSTDPVSGANAAWMLSTSEAARASSPMGRAMADPIR